MDETEMYGVDISGLALACLYKNLGLASPIFGTTTRAHPSRNVLVSLTGTLKGSEGDRDKFPIEVSCDIWEYVCVPVLQDDAVMVKTTTGSLRNQNNIVLLEETPPRTLLGKIETALIAQFQELGIFPQEEGSGTTETEAGMSTFSGAAGAGEPIVRPTDPLGDDLRWPEGHPRLTYPEVD